MRIAIRPAVAEDAESILAIYGPVVQNTPISFELEPPSVEEMRRRIVDTLAKFPWLVGVQDGELLGYAYGSLHHQRPAYQWAVDVSVYVHPQAHRRGVGRALYSSLLEILRLQGYATVCAGIALPNAASVGLHEAMGFEPVGVYRHVGYKLGAWHDVGWWQLDLRQTDGKPAPLIPFSELRETEKVKASLMTARANTSH
jgi:phosphinothricin acetyltransferase